MDAHDQFERLVRMVQETGERMVVSLLPEKDPVVLLPLQAYEELVRAARGQKVGHQQVPRQMGVAYDDAPLVKSEVNLRVQSPANESAPDRHYRENAPQQESRRESAEQKALFSALYDARKEAHDPEDIWDSEYDAEHIFERLQHQREDRGGYPRQEPRQTGASETPRFHASETHPGASLRHPSEDVPSEAVGKHRQFQADETFRYQQGLQNPTHSSNPFQGEERFSLGLG